MIIRIGEDTVSCRHCGHILFRCLNQTPQDSDPITCLGCKKTSIYADLIEGMRLMLSEFRGLETETADIGDIDRGLKNA